jgi:hypothetical protein
MTGLATSVGTAVTNSIRGVLARSGQLLLKSGMCWLAVVSLYRGLRPGQAFAGGCRVVRYPLVS